MSSSRTFISAAFLIATATVTSASFAQEREPEPDPNGGTVRTQGGTTVVTAPPGSGGVTVVAPTPGGGQVMAQGCQQVVVNGSPTMVTPTGAPCPQYAPYQPYAPQQSYYEQKPRFAPDGERKGAIIASSIVYGVGAGLTGLTYLITDSESNCSSSYDGTSYQQTCSKGNSRGWLVAYGAITTVVPSIPRFVVGDVTKGLIFSGLRGASVLTASLIDWGHNDSTSWQGPFLLGFAVPVTLAIIDLAMTPHREDLEDKVAPVARSGVRLTSLAPVPVTTPQYGTHGGMVSMTGQF